MKKHNNFSEKKIFKRKVLRCIAIILALSVVFTVLLLILKNWEQTQQTDDAEITPQIVLDTKTFNGKEYEPKNNVDTILVMGLDERSSEIVYDENAVNNSQESDFLMLFVFDNTNSTYKALHINRDTMTKVGILDMSGVEYTSDVMQIALAHTFGNGKKDSCKNTVKAVEGLLDNINIEGYLSVPMDSVAEINDLLGGVEVTVLQDLTSVDPALEMGKTLTLENEQALLYVRTRYGLDDSSNKARMDRQKQYLENLFDTFVEAINTDETILEDLYNSNTFSSMEASNVDKLEGIAKRLPDYKFEGIFSLDGEYNTVVNDKGEPNMEFTPSDSSIEETIINLFYTPIEK